MPPKKFTKTLVSKLSKKDLQDKAAEYGFLEKCLKPQYVDFFMKKKTELGDEKMLRDFSDLFAALSVADESNQPSAGASHHAPAVPPPVNSGGVRNKTTKVVQFSTMDSVSQFDKNEAPVEVKKESSTPVLVPILEPVNVHTTREKMMRDIKSAKNTREIMAAIKNPDVSYLEDLAHIDDAMLRAFGLA